MRKRLRSPWVSTCISLRMDQASLLLSKQLRGGSRGHDSMQARGSMFTEHIACSFEYLLVLIRCGTPCQCLLVEGLYFYLHPDNLKVFTCCRCSASRGRSRSGNSVPKCFVAQLKS